MKIKESPTKKYPLPSSKIIQKKITGIIRKKASKKMFIVAAVVGAVPKYINPLLPYYFQQEYLDVFYSNQQEILNILSNAGWVKTIDRALTIKIGIINKIYCAQLESLPLNQKLEAKNWLKNNRWVKDNDVWIEPSSDYLPANYMPVLSAKILNKIPDETIKRALILSLTNQGWVFNEEGNLIWMHITGQSYIEHKYFQYFTNEFPELITYLNCGGWKICGPGYWRPAHNSTPYLPILAGDIISQAYNAANEGAAIVHLHTRNLTKGQAYTIPGTIITDDNLSQHNDIMIDDYEKIVPSLIRYKQDLIINLSTSVRGSEEDSDNPKRRIHLKKYGAKNLAPDIASLSLSAVIFQNGTGYNNSSTFLQRQISKMLELGIRPEIEVFNHTILDYSISLYSDSIRKMGIPPLFMLVAGVDQYKDWPKNLPESKDDSLIPRQARISIFNLLHKGRKQDQKVAIKLALSYLRPAVLKIRKHHRDAQISILMPGIMHSIIVEVAVKLKLNGIRVGLEDGLNVIDPTIVGGVRRALSTADQVIRIRSELLAKNIELISCDELRQSINMVRPEIKLFRQFAAFAKKFTYGLPDIKTITNPKTILSKLSFITDQYKQIEDRFIADILSKLKLYCHDPAILGSFVFDMARQHGIAIRFSNEESDRYEIPENFPIQYIYIVQSLNFMREILSERQLSTSTFDENLIKLDAGENASKFIIKQQFKNLETRSLEYIFSISSQYNEDYTAIINTQIRQDKNYNHAMTLLCHLLKYQMIKLRLSSNAKDKQANILWYNQISAKDANNLNNFNQIGVKELHRMAANNSWICLPSTPMTNYETGIKISKSYFKLMKNFITNAITKYQSPKLQDHELTILGLVNSGLEKDGEVIIEATMLENRFASNIDKNGSLVTFSSQQIYDQLILPRIIERPTELCFQADGVVKRNLQNQPLYVDQTVAKRINSSKIRNLTFLKMIGFSSAVVTMQFIDNSLRKDMNNLGFSPSEQCHIFKKAILFHFGSTANINLSLSGTTIIDVTAINDIRSIAGTTSTDYTNVSIDIRKLLINNHNAECNNNSSVKIISSANCRNVIRYNNIVLSRDPGRLHDGHSIKYYTQEAPEHLKALITIANQSKVVTNSLKKWVNKASLLVESRKLNNNFNYDN